jgi:hypothetical protein
MKFNLRIEVEAESLEAAQAIRDEMAGAGEDYTESSRNASASFGDMQEIGTDRHTALVELARDKFAMASDNDIEVYDDARTSESDGGIWVQGWLWLSNGTLETAGLMEGEEEEGGSDD